MVVRPSSAAAASSIDLAQRQPHGQPGQVQVGLVDQGRDARVDLEQAVAEELDVHDPVQPKRLDQPARVLEQVGPVDDPELHGQPGPERLTRLGACDQRAAVPAERVHRQLLALDQLHHQHLGEPLAAVQDLDGIREGQRQQGARPSAQQLLAPVGAGRQHPEAARALRLERLHADVAARVAQLGGRRPEAGRIGGRDRARLGDAQPFRQTHRLRLGAGALDRVRARHQHRNAEALGAGRDRAHLGRGLREHHVDALLLGHLQQCLQVARVRPGRHPPEAVAQEAPGRLVAHVHADQPHRAPVRLPQRPQQPR